jgi:hypothetical protein
MRGLGWFGGKGSLARGPAPPTLASLGRSPILHPMRILLVLLVLLGACDAVRLSAQAAAMGPQEVHDRIVAVIRRSATRSVAAGDTFVTWSPRPVLYSTVRRIQDRVESSLIRADGMVGSADATWQQGVQTSVQIRWTKGAEEPLTLRARIEGGQILLSGSRDTAMVIPSLPWAIADYGMEDQLLPLIDMVANRKEPQAVLVYRPYPNRWDSLTVAVEAIPGGRRATLVESEGERWTWVISDSGALVQILRSRHPDVERRPLETTARMADYVRLRQASPALR